MSSLTYDLLNCFFLVVGMHEEEEQEKTAASPPVIEHPDYLKDPHSHKGTHVKSVCSNKEDTSAIDSIRELRKSLAASAVQKKLSPTTGYVDCVLLLFG